MIDYVPKSDAEFNNWQNNLVEIVSENAEAWNIASTDLENLKTKQNVSVATFAKANNKQNRTQADVLAKNEARQDYEKNLRSFVAQWLASNNKVTDVDRTRMGLTVKSGTRTATPIPTTSPVGSIDFSVRLQHTVHFFDEASPRSKAKPTGVHGCEIYIKVDGEAPKDASELTYVATDTATPYVVKFDGNKAGKTAYYWLRWVNTRGETGPWSIAVSAMVAG